MRAGGAHPQGFSIRFHESGVSLRGFGLRRCIQNHPKGRKQNTTFKNICVLGSSESEPQRTHSDVNDTDAASIHSQGMKTLKDVHQQLEVVKQGRSVGVPHGLFLIGVFNLFNGFTWFSVVCYCFS